VTRSNIILPILLLALWCLPAWADVSNPAPAASSYLKTTGAPVGLSAGAPGVAGNMLTLDSATAASWQAPASAAELATTGAAVNVSAAAPPVAGQVLQATAATTATWQTPLAARQSFNTTAVNVGLTAAQANTLWVNGADVEITLPATGDMTSGDWFTFAVNHNSYLRINCAAGGVDTARYLATATAASGYFRSTSVGDSLTVIYLGGTEWKIVGLAGTWTYDS
jgi:hypothetical protein